MNRGSIIGNALAKTKIFKYDQGSNIRTPFAEMQPEVFRPGSDAPEGAKRKTGDGQLRSSLE
jgi:hypothetical protein